MNGYLGILFLLGFYTVILLSFLFSTNDIKKSIGATMFIGLILSLLLISMELIPNLVLFVMIIGAGLSIAFMFGEN